MKKTLILILIFLIQLPSYGGVIWERKINNFSRIQYQASAQNWMVECSESGLIYVANSDGLLEFDGKEWSLYQNQGRMVRSVKVQKDRIYVGGSSEFGYYSKNPIGKLEYHSLSSPLNDWGGEVWNILAMEHYILFISDTYIHKYDINTNEIKQIIAPSKINSSSFIDNTLYLGCQDALYFSESDKLTPIPETRSVADGKIVEILELNKKILLVTANKGLFTLQDNRISSLHTIADQFIKDNRLFSANIKDGILALGSVQSGVYMFNLTTNSSPEMFNLKRGLNNNTILNIHFDYKGNLWLALDNGISHIELDESVRPLFSNISPIGTGYTVKKYNNELYFGTNQGLYKFDKNNEPIMVNNIQGQIWSLSVIDDALFCSGDNGIYVLEENNNFYSIPVTGAWEVKKAQGIDNTLIVGTYYGLSVLKKENGKWRFSHLIADLHESVRGIVDDEEIGTIWLIKKNSTISRIRINKEYTTAEGSKDYDIPERVIKDNIFVNKVNNRLVVCMDEGVFYYDRLKDSFVEYEELENILEKPNSYSYLYEDKYKNVWYYNRKGLNTLVYDNGIYKKKQINWGLRNEIINTHDNIILTDPTIAIVATNNGFVKLNLGTEQPHFEDKAFIRKIISSKNDSTLAYGSSIEKLQIKYENNSIRFEFTSNSFDFQSNDLYIYKLEGLDEEWSIPVSSNTKEYTNLKEGEYVFKVRLLKGDDESFSVEDSIRFSILPPWYRSIWAILIYVAIIYICLYMLYRKTIRRQKIIINQQKLEQELKDRKIYELHNQNLQNELQYKSQELAGRILDLSRKNEILEDVKRGVVNIGKSIDEEKKYSTLKQMTTLLISQINKNLDDHQNFKAFESNFNIVHKDFFNILDHKFPDLTKRERILCAYLKMGLSSKEIAPIQGISVRSVEVNRYRLRKKLNIDQDTNISKFLQDLQCNS